MYYILLFFSFILLPNSLFLECDDRMRCSRGTAKPTLTRLGESSRYGELNPQGKLKPKRSLGHNGGSIEAEGHHLFSLFVHILTPSILFVVLFSDDMTILSQFLS